MNSSVQTAADGSAVATCPLPPFYFVVTFWGENYRKWFCKFTLPALLAPNNIPALRHPAECRFLICTTCEDWVALQGEPMFVLLKTHIEPVFLELPPIRAREHKYHQMSRGHEVLTNACHQAKACAIYFASDTIVPDGCVAVAQRLVEAGKRVVLCTAIRFDMDGVEAELVSRGLLGAGRPLILSRRDAVAVGLRHLHPESQAGNWAAQNFGALSGEHNRTDFPVCCFWEVPDGHGIVIHTHNWAPFAINFASLSTHDTHSFKRWAIDGDYIYRNFGQAKMGEEVYVVEDSDEMILLGLTPRNEMVPPARPRLFHSFPVLEEWVKGYMVNQVVFDTHTDPLRRKIYPIPVRWHSDDLSPAWAEVEAQARKVMATYTEYDLSPMRHMFRSQHIRDWFGLIFSRRILSFWWSVLMAFLLMPMRVSSFLSRWWARLRSYARIILSALSGDSVQRMRIRNRVRTFVSTFSRSR